MPILSFSFALNENSIKLQPVVSHVILLIGSIFSAGLKEAHKSNDATHATIVEVHNYLDEDTLWKEK